jgi:3'(2'),5'-bisphosphate nucleotidase
MISVDFTLLEQLAAIAEEAGQAIMALYQQSFTIAEKADTSPLTEADLQADACIRQHLQSLFPHVPILSEESAAPSSPSQQFFLVDPLDGTKEFISQNGEFTVNIALIQHGIAVAGIVLAPALNELFFAATQLGAWKRLNGTLSQLTPINQAIDTSQPLRVLGSRSHGSEAMDAWLLALQHPYDLQATGSSLKFCRIAEGAADVYPRFGPTSQWDTAAGQCIVEAVGGSVLSTNGQALRYGLELPILNPHFLAAGHFNTANTVKSH